MLSESHDLYHWSSKFHQSLSDFDDVAGDFQTLDVQILLKTVYHQKCSSSLDSLNNTQYIGIKHLPNFRYVPT